MILDEFIASTGYLFKYIRTPSAESYTEARSALEHAVKTDHDSSRARTALGGMYVDDCMLFGGSTDQLDRALALVKHAYREAPHDYTVQFIRVIEGLRRVGMELV